MTIEQLEIMQKQKRQDGQRMPSGAVSLDQAMVLALTETVMLLTEICIELKQSRMHE